jgi:hypothetical protein
LIKDEQCADSIGGNRCIKHYEHEDTHVDVTGNTWVSMTSNDILNAITITKDTPTQAIRYDDGKPAYDLIPAKALHELVLVYSMGAKKYAPRNWEKGMAYSRMFASMMRHAWAFWRGEDKDPESGLHHMAHVAFGALGLVEYSLRNIGEDDRV